MKLFVTLKGMTENMVLMQYVFTSRFNCSQYTHYTADRRRECHEIKAAIYGLSLLEMLWKHSQLLSYVEKKKKKKET